MTFQALLFCPDEKTARVTTQVLNELEFSVEACTEPFAAVKKLMGQHFDAIVVDCENEQNAALLFKSARNSSSNQGSLAVAVVEGQTGVANAFRIGANLVLTKPINVEQAKSTLRVARGLLRKGGEAAKAMPPTPMATTSAPAPAPPARPASPSLETARPAAPTPPTPKPAFAAFQPPKPQPLAAVAKTTVEASSTFEVEQEPTPAPDAAEEILLESMNEKAHATPPKPAATSKPAAAPEFPWQPVAKPSSPMANSLQRAAEALEKKQAETAAKAPSSQKPSTVPNFKQNPPLAGGLASGPTGSAAAPAPARETVTPIAPAALKTSAPVVTSSTGSLTTEISKREAAAAPVPTFGALDRGSEDSAEAGVSKKWIVIVAAVAVLAIAGYFGYTKFASSKQSKPEVQVPTQTATPAAAPVVSESTPAAATVVMPSTSTQPSHLASAPANKPAPTVAAEDETSPEVVVTHPDAPKTMVVKSGIGSAASKKKAEEAPAADAPAPALGMGSEDQNTISNLVKSAPVTVPKVATSNSSDVLRISQGVTQGLLLKRVQPIYPHQAMQMRIQGAVQLQATINKQGSITSVKILSGDAILARAAVEAVNQWKYKPYFLNGEPVDIQTQITVNFKLP
jgi:periplasmic protein TonB